MSYKNQQRTTSADTSVNVVNRIYTNYNFLKGSRILDYGGGKYNSNVDYMKEKGCNVLVYDPFNRSESHNQTVIDAVCKQGVDYIVCSNVLNVIDNDSDLHYAIQQMAKLSKISTSFGHNGLLLVTVYEGDSKYRNIGRETSKGYQRNMLTRAYLPYLEPYFRIVSIKNKIIVCEVL